MFRRYGNFLISFHVEGTDVDGVKPLYYPIRVDLSDIPYGISNAYRRLRANAFEDRNNRQVASSVYDNIVHQFIGKYTNVDDFEALKHVMFVVYYSLPNGCLADSSVSDTCNAFQCFTDAYGWNNVLDYVWRAEVATGTSSVRFMECCLLLELNIEEHFLRNDQALSALPCACEAICRSSLSSVALRLFTLDQHLQYDQACRANTISRDDCCIAENLVARGSRRPKRNVIKRNNSGFCQTKVDYDDFDEDEQETEEEEDDSDF